jgi:4'-phosphopantetheinyl transferase
MGNLESDPGQFPELRPRELHVWRVELDAPPTATDRLAACLSADERRQWQRFLREADRRHFLVSHSALRIILGQYLDMAPERVEIAVRTGGKPELTLSPDGLPLCFNLSHSEGLAMVALALGREVGVDVERVRPFVDMASIIERYFAPAERAAWQALPPEDRCAAFFRCWTRKEAYLKARGIGLAEGLDHFEVPMAAAEPLSLLWTGGPPGSTERYQMYDVSQGPDYAAACVVEREVEAVSVYDLSPLSLCEGDQG